MDVIVNIMLPTSITDLSQYTNGVLLDAIYFFAALTQQSFFMLSLAVLFGTETLGQQDALCCLVYISWFSVIYLCSFMPIAG